MAEQTTSSIVIDATPDEVMAVIADFEAYPQWIKGMRSAKILEVEDGKVSQVRFQLDATPIKDTYVLAYDWSVPDELSWELVEGRMLTEMDGTYMLHQVGRSGTEVTYRLCVDVAIPLIGLLKRRAEKVIVDTALKGLKKRVEAR